METAGWWLPLGKPWGSWFYRRVDTVRPLSCMCHLWVRSQESALCWFLYLSSVLLPDSRTAFCTVMWIAFIISDSILNKTMYVPASLVHSTYELHGLCLCAETEKFILLLLLLLKQGASGGLYSNILLKTESVPSSGFLGFYLLCLEKIER